MTEPANYRPIYQIKLSECLKIWAGTMNKDFLTVIEQIETIRAGMLKPTAVKLSIIE